MGLATGALVAPETGRDERASVRTRPERATDQRPVPEDLATLAYRRILQEILAGSIQPDAPLRVERLATRYKISHTPVKQALARLLGEGIVAHLPNRGMRVHVLDEDDCRAVVEARLMCELFAVRHGLPTAPAAGIARVLDLIARYEAAAAAPRTDALAWHDQLVHTDTEIHTAIVQLANNPRISVWHAQMTVLLHGRRLLRTRDVNEVPESVLERTIRTHREIGHALEWRDRAAAEAAISAHIEPDLALLTAPVPQPRPLRGRSKRHS